MKRSAWIQILTLILSLFMLLSLVACGGSGEEVESETSGNNQTETGSGETTEIGSSEDTEDEGGNSNGVIPEFESLEKTLYLSAQRLTVFSEPKLSGEKIGTLTYGERVSVVAVNTFSGWYKIALADGSFGYVASSSVYFSETDPDEVESDSGDESGSDTETTCEHPYAATESGHYKPACSVCGKKEGKVQDHQYEEKVEDGGDVWLYSFECTVCGYDAYVQEVPYEVNAFFAPGEIAALDTNSTFAGGFLFETGTGFAAFTKSGGGSGNIKVVETQEAGAQSGRYLVMKVRLPGSQSSFTVSVKSLSATGNFNMSFSDLKPGWVTIIADMTTAIDTDSKGNPIGYQPNADGEYYLSYLSINGRVLSEEHFDVAYVMLCEELSEAVEFTANEKQIFTYSDVKNTPDFEKKPCLDKDGNEIKHTIISDENGHSVAEPCYQCGLTQVEDEPHVFTQMRVNGELTYACAVCEYLQYGYYLNKYFSEEDINNNAITYYKVDKSLLSEDGVEFSRFVGRGTTAQVIFARNNYASSAVEEAAAFPVGRGHLLVIRMRTNAPEVKFRILISTVEGKEQEVVFPTSMATVISEPDAENTEYGWTTYVIDLPRAVPSVFVPDQNGEYKITNIYYQMGTNTGLDYTADVYYDFDFMAFVDSWDEIRALVPDQTVVKVNATNNGTLVKTQEQECVGEHSWGENVEDNVYSYLCVNCGTPLKTVVVPECVEKYFSGFEVARNGVVYAASGDRDVFVDPDNTIFGRVSNHAEIWWMRSQKDYSYGSTGGALDGKSMDVGNAKYFVIRLRTNNSSKNFEFYISTTGKNGTPRTENDPTDKPMNVPTTSGSIVFSTPVQASTAGEWTTYVFDLETLLPEHYVKDPETGTYIIDTFGIAYSREYNADIDFMAFVDGSWAEIDSITPDDTVVYATNYKNKTYSVLKVSDGTCVDCSKQYTAIAEEDGSVTYNYQCAACGKIYSSHNIPAEVNQFYALDKMVKYGATDNGILGEGAVVYHSYSFSSGGHIFINTSNAYTDISGDTGKLLVLKYRASGNASITLEIGTEDKNVIPSWGTPGTVDGDVSFTRPAGSVSTEWCVAVVDLSLFNYSLDSNEKVQVRITTASSTIDIAYAAIVDDISEAESLIDEEIDPTYTYFTNWKTDAGEVREIAK